MEIWKPLASTEIPEQHCSIIRHCNEQVMATLAAIAPHVNLPNLTSIAAKLYLHVPSRSTYAWWAIDLSNERDQDLTIEDWDQQTLEYSLTFLLIIPHSSAGSNPGLIINLDGPGGLQINLSLPQLIFDVIKTPDWYSPQLAATLAYQIRRVQEFSSIFHAIDAVMPMPHGWERKGGEEGGEA